MDKTVNADEIETLSSTTRGELLARVQGVLGQLFKEAKSSGGEGDRSRDEKSKLVARAWAQAAAKSELDAAEAMIHVGLRTTFAESLGWMRSIMAAELFDAFAAEPKAKAAALLGLLGAAHKDEEGGFLPVACAAGDRRSCALALSVARASVASLLAFGEGSVAGRPGLGSAQLCAGASANPGLSEPERDACLLRLKELCDLDPEAASMALLMLAGGPGRDEPDIAELDSALYQEAFRGKALGRGPLMHALARRSDGQALIDWCQAAGLEGADWPASPAACLMDIEPWHPDEGLSECMGDLIGRYPEEAAARLNELDPPRPEEAVALARELGRMPECPRALRELAPAFFEAVFSEPRAREAAWDGWAQRSARLEACFGQGEFGVEMLSRGTIALVQTVGMEEAGGTLAAASTRVDSALAALRGKPEKSEKESRQLAELERASLAPARAKSAPRKPAL